MNQQLQTLIPVELHSCFADILGENRNVMSDEARKDRWAEWKKLAGQEGETGKAVVEYWTSNEETCSGCKHRDHDWCTHSQLPCSVNPILSFRMAIPGMACMGLGYTR